MATTTDSRPVSVVQGRWGLSGEVDYTYSHEIDITSTDDSGVDNPFNIKYMQGLRIVRPAPHSEHQLHLQAAHLQRAGLDALDSRRLGACWHCHR